MSQNLFYVVGTLCAWVGWFLVFRALAMAAKLVSKDPAVDRQVGLRSLATNAFSAAVLLGLNGLLPMQVDPGVVKAPFRFPLIWFVMPWSAWLCVAAIAATVGRGLQGTMAIDAQERQDRFKSMLGWIGAAILFAFLYTKDPANKITVLKGGIGLTPNTAAAILLFAVAGTAAMVFAGRETASRNFAKGLVTQIALLAGAFVFGLPFAFLVITSFKEDRDMSSPNGIVWVPRVQDTVPYRDPKDPVYQGKYEGQDAQGSVIERYPDGRVKIDILKPMSIRGYTFIAPLASLTEVPKDSPMVEGNLNGSHFTGFVVKQMDDGHRNVQFTSPEPIKGQQKLFEESELTPLRHVGLRTQNYPAALDFLPLETNHGLVYLKNTLLIVIFSVIGTILSSAVVAYAFSRMQFPGRDKLFALVLGTMMLPGAVTLMPQFLIFRSFGWIDTLLPLWVPSFFGSAFNIFLLRQFFMQIPMELEDAAKIDGCSYPKTFWSIMMPLIKPALAVIAIWTFMGSWNNFMGPLIYVNSPENMPLSYALKLFQGDRSGDPGLLMAFATLTMLPVLALFFFAQRYFIEGVTLSGLGGR